MGSRKAQSTEGDPVINKLAPPAEAECVGVDAGVVKTGDRGSTSMRDSIGTSSTLFGMSGGPPEVPRSGPQGEEKVRRLSESTDTTARFVSASSGSAGFGDRGFGSLFGAQGGASQGEEKINLFLGSTEATTRFADASSGSTGFGDR